MAVPKYYKHIGIIFVLSSILTLLMFYVDESRYSSGFLTKPREIVMLIAFAIFFTGVPLAIYNVKKSFGFSMVGFVPSLMILCWLVF